MVAQVFLIQYYYQISIKCKKEEFEDFIKMIFGNHRIHV
ncbi:hypothetical protein JCM19302_2577 [Jejuia pallidilutea]|uniref:Uncharacterized protein n=1 Tax=Jejuia pallidilutea TaxID=504487 RepID=A0A090WRJ3_9FLAO|nr:hypothetical protein JCM19302_2577 [Jejuia pallidilutea]